MIDLPRRHIREESVERAKSAIHAAIVEATGHLTMWETVRVVSDVLGGVLGNMAKYGIRDERHPGDPERPGGWQ